MTSQELLEKQALEVAGRFGLCPSSMALMHGARALSLLPRLNDVLTCDCGGTECKRRCLKSEVQAVVDSSQGGGKF